MRERPEAVVNLSEGALQGWAFKCWAEFEGLVAGTSLCGIREEPLLVARAWTVWNYNLRVSIKPAGLGTDLLRSHVSQGGNFSRGWTWLKTSSPKSSADPSTSTLNSISQKNSMVLHLEELWHEFQGSYKRGSGIHEVESAHVPVNTQTSFVPRHPVRKTRRILLFPSTVESSYSS